ncbi:hypothetical protein FIM02_03170 [SAR202 cluster bacterium AD-802-E10_MRT_200m]|nr:hypothetical protein [SAR202 cluster bacterium AD-802-E10_MRT_200m]
MKYYRLHWYWLYFPYLILFGVIVSMACSEDTELPGNSVLLQCVQHEQVSMHTHANFFPVLQGAPQLLPAGIGITEDCMRPLHTHGNDFVIHIESPQDHNFTIGDFFEVWGDGNPYKGLPVFSISVNGTRYSGPYHNLVLSDGLRVIIDFGDR